MQSIRLEFEKTTDREFGLNLGLGTQASGVSVFFNSSFLYIKSFVQASICLQKRNQYSLEHMIFRKTKNKDKINQSPRTYRDFKSYVPPKILGGACYAFQYLSPRPPPQTTPCYFLPFLVKSCHFS